MLVPLSDGAAREFESSGREISIQSGPVQSIPAPSHNCDRLSTFREIENSKNKFLDVARVHMENALRDRSNNVLLCRVLKNFIPTVAFSLNANFDYPNITTVLPVSIQTVHRISLCRARVEKTDYL